MVEVNEDGTVGGSHQALFDLAASLVGTNLEPVVLFYQANRYCPSLRERGIEVDSYESARKHEVHVRHHGSWLAKYPDFLGAVLRRAKLLREKRVDLVHLINSPTVGADDWLPACRLAGVPCIASAMGLLPRTLGPVHRFLVRRFDRILACSGSIASGLEHHGVSSNVQVVHLGVDLDRFRAGVRRSRDALRSELHVPADAVMVTMVGNIRPWKGQHVALEAMAQLPPAVRSRLRLLIAGATSEEQRDYHDRLVSIVRSHGLESCVSLLGERRDIADLFHASDLALHASLHPEPFGLVLVEAMAVGTPVVASNRGGPTEIVSEESGFLFDPDRPTDLAALLGRLCESPQRLRAMADAARARSEAFSVQKMTTATRTAYLAVLDASGFYEA